MVDTLTQPILKAMNKLQQAIAHAVNKQEFRETELHKVLNGNVPIVPKNKYNVSNKESRTYIDGTVFASKSEMERWDYLLKLQLAKEIKDLEQQVPFTLQESFYTSQYGKVDHIVYVADFVYTNISYRRGLENITIVEDSKTGIRTPEYKIKRKLFLYKYPQYAFFEV